VAVWASSTTLSSAEPPQRAPTTSSDNRQLRAVSRRDSTGLNVCPIAPVRALPRTK
jgi:hypothetical protein